MQIVAILAAGVCVMGWFVAAIYFVWTAWLCASDCDDAEQYIAEQTTLQITIERTPDFRPWGGAICQVWLGHTHDGQPVECLVATLRDPTTPQPASGGRKPPDSKSILAQPTPAEIDHANT